MVIPTLESDVLYDVVRRMLSGIRQAYPIPQGHYADEAIDKLDEAIHYYLWQALNESTSQNGGELYELTLDAIRDETAKLVEEYNRQAVRRAFNGL
jgi:Na+/phosphate symporter